MSRRTEIFKDDIVSLRFAVRRGVERYENDELAFKKRYNREDDIKMSQIAHGALDRMWRLSLEQGWNRRSRKARKNLVMYKLAGKRPWDCGPFGEVLDSLSRQLGDGQRLREASGFAAMSRRAEGMKRHPYDEFEEWLQESWGDLTPDEIAERIGRQP